MDRASGRLSRVCHYDWRRHAWHYVRAYPPWRIERELAEWRQRIEQFWCWDEEGGACRRNVRSNRSVIADTIDGDEVAFHPCRPNELFVLPRHGPQTIRIVGDFWSTLDWLCTSGELTDAFDERDFEPYDSRLEQTATTKKADESKDPKGESLDEILQLAKRWTKRHNMRQAAKKALDKE